jgi:hypothetical protein
MSTCLKGAAALLCCLAVPASGTSAATLTADAPCYVSGSNVTVSGTGFGAGNAVFVEGPQMFSSVPADEAGAISTVVKAPSNGAFIEPGYKNFTLKATDQVTQVNASVSFDVANLTFATSGGVKSPNAKRSWKFSGFIQRPGKPIYGHFRNGGRTYANYRFGIPTGRCGTLRKTAPGIPTKKLRTGKWLIQVDYEPRYHKNTSPRVTSTTTVFTTFR